MSEDDEEDRTVQELAPVRSAGGKPPIVPDDEEPEDATEVSTIERRVGVLRIKTPGYGETIELLDDTRASPRGPADAPASSDASATQKQPSVKFEQTPIAGAPASTSAPSQRESSSALGAVRAPQHTVLGLAPSTTRAASTPEPGPMKARTRVSSAPDAPTAAVMRADAGLPRHSPGSEPDDSITTRGLSPAHGDPADLPEDSITALHSMPEERFAKPARMHADLGDSDENPAMAADDSITAAGIVLRASSPDTKMAPTQASPAHATLASPKAPAIDLPDDDDFEDSITTKGPITIPPEFNDEPDSVTTKAPRDLIAPAARLLEQSRQLADPSEEMDSLVSVTAQIPSHVADALRIASTDAKAAKSSGLRARTSEMPKPLPARNLTQKLAGVPVVPPPPRPTADAHPMDPHFPQPAPARARPSAPVRAAPPTSAAYVAAAAPDPPSISSLPTSIGAIPVIPSLLPDGESIAFAPPRFDDPSAAARRGELRLPSIVPDEASWSSLPQGISTSSADPVSQSRWVLLVVGVASASILIPFALFLYLRRSDDDSITTSSTTTAASATPAASGSAGRRPAVLSASVEVLDDSDPRTKKLRPKPKKPGWRR